VDAAQYDDRGLAAVMKRPRPRALAALIVALGLSVRVGADEPRSVFNDAWVASGTVASVWMMATKPAGPDGPERVRRLWFSTCVVDAWAAGLTSFDDAADKYGDDCVRWAQTPSTAMQTRGTATPYTAGTLNSMMLVTVYGTAVTTLRKMFPGASEDQIQAATGCLVDLHRSKGVQAMGDAVVENGPCFRYAAITNEHMKRPTHGKAKPKR
jgi:hypothetical protein